MSLEELRAQAEAEEETTEVDEPEAEDELEAGEESEKPESGETEEDEPVTEVEEYSEDFELELEGESPGQQKPSPEDALVYKLTKERKQKKEYRDKVEELEARLSELQAQVAGGSRTQAQATPQVQQEQYPRVPLLYENGIDTPEQYQEAYRKWVADTKAIDQRNAQRNTAQSEYKRQMEEKSRSLAQRMGKFATEHKIKDERVVSAIERATSEVDSATNIEGALVHLLDSVGDGSERVAYYIGTNDAAMSKVKQLLQEDPNGLKVIAHMTRLAEKLKPGTRSKTSKAPAPDEPLRGDGAPASQKRLQADYDKASDSADLGKMKAITKRARELGVKLN